MNLVFRYFENLNSEFGFQYKTMQTKERLKEKIGSGNDLNLGSFIKPQNTQKSRN